MRFQAAFVSLYVKKKNTTLKNISNFMKIGIKELYNYFILIKKL